ncbi:hypothetical protein [Pseudomonas sp. CC6-YY-74]|uniref:hypothetical protein n=1 Tax=Pseudomonas sp. CC6-YY-74 TaxID=1930532 RepID=UPI0009A159FC|nr:hypothetical protein [Pseudomonas sp. CC6-YY-74]
MGLAQMHWSDHRDLPNTHGKEWMMEFSGIVMTASYRKLWSFCEKLQSRELMANGRSSFSLFEQAHIARLYRWNRPASA